MTTASEQSELPELTEWRVQHAEDALRMVRAQIDRVQSRHNLTFLPIPDLTDAAKREQRRQYTLLMLEYGVVIGLVEMGHKSGWLTGEQYQSLRNEALQLTMPGVVGVVGSFIGV